MDRIAVYCLILAVVGMWTLKGYLAHLWAVDRWPHLDDSLPRDAGALVGALVGVTVAALWSFVL